MAKVIEMPVTHKVNDEAIRQAMRPRKRRWNRQRAWDNLLTVVGIAAAGVFFAYLVLSWMAGEPW